MVLESPQTDNTEKNIMTTATATGLTLEEVSTWTNEQIDAHLAKVNQDKKLVNDLLKKREADEDLESAKALEEIEKEFAALQDLTFKVEAGDEVMELSLHDALFGVKTKIKAKAKGSDEIVDRDHTASLSKATVTAIRRAVANLAKIAHGEPRRTSKKTEGQDQ